MKKLHLLIVALFLNCTHNTICSSDKSNSNAPKLTIHAYNSSRDRDTIVRMIAQYPATTGADIDMIEHNFNFEKATQGIDLARYGVSQDMIKQFKNKKEQSFTKVLRINDETTIGFANYSKDPEDSSGHIHMVGINEQHKNKGYARQLLTFGMKNFKKEGIESAFVTVHESNTPARRLYSRLGFTTHTTYGAPQDTGYIFLQKKLQTDKVHPIHEKA